MITHGVTKDIVDKSIASAMDKHRLELREGCVQFLCAAFVALSALISWRARLCLYAALVPSWTR